MSRELLQGKAFGLPGVGRSGLASPLKGLLAGVTLCGLVLAPTLSLGEQQAVEVKDGSAVEIACSKSRDVWEPIMTLGPVDVAEEETSLSKDIKVTLKYLFLRGSQRRRVTLLVKWTQNAKLALEVNSKQLCDSKGTTGVRTTISGQTQVSDGKAVLPSGYMRILPEDLD